MANIFNEEALTRAWGDHLKQMADKIAGELAAAAAKEFEARLKKQLIDSVHLILDRNLNISRMRDELHIMIQMGNKP